MMYMVDSDSRRCIAGWFFSVGCKILIVSASREKDCSRRQIGRVQKIWNRVVNAQESQHDGAIEPKYILNGGTCCMYHCWRSYEYQTTVLDVSLVKDNCCGHIAFDVIGILRYPCLYMGLGFIDMGRAGN